MKALSIRQPWAWAIVHAGKRIENRSWATSYRGPVLLHAGKGCTLREYNDARDFMTNPDFGQIEVVEHVLRTCNGVPELGDLPRGGIVGRADIVNCISASTSGWFFGPFGFVLENVRPLPFTPLRGSLGLFDVDESDLAEIESRS